VLRIDDTAKTLVSPHAGGFVHEDALDRDELLTLLTSGWDAFAHELGHQSMRLCAARPVPGLDLLAFDEHAGRAVMAQIASADAEREIGRALVASSVVAGWSEAELVDVHEALAAAVPGDSPGIIFVGASFDGRMLGALDWLARRHHVATACFAVSVLRFGSERLLAVRREFPPTEGPPVDHAAEVQRLLGDSFPEVGVATTPAPAGSHSTPPPGA